MKKLLFITGLVFAINSSADDSLLDRVKTPGVLNPDVTQATLNTTVCVPNWTKTIRPPASYTNKLKAKQLADARYTDKDMTHYEEDHFVPLSSGGNSTAEGNLWAQPRFGNNASADKDIVESGVHRDLCKGKLTLQQAQNIFLSDWRLWLEQYKKTDSKTVVVD